MLGKNTFHIISYFIEYDWIMVDVTWFNLTLFFSSIHLWILMHDHLPNHGDSRCSKVLTTTTGPAKWQTLGICMKSLTIDLDANGRKKSNLKSRKEHNSRPRMQFDQGHFPETKFKYVPEECIWTYFVVMNLWNCLWEFQPTWLCAHARDLGSQVWLFKEETTSGFHCV